MVAALEQKISDLVNDKKKGSPVEIVGRRTFILLLEVASKMALNESGLTCIVLKACNTLRHSAAGIMFLVHSSAPDRLWSRLQLSRCKQIQHTHGQREKEA
jgi:hypothetical protein